MPEQASTHAPHLDDSMAAETEALTRGAPVESRAHEGRMAEPPDDDLEVVAIVDFAAEPLPGTLGESERRRRSELAIALRPHAFPGERDDLLRVAEGEGAATWIVDALAQLPIDTRFDTPQEVWVALGGHRELRGVEHLAGGSEPPPPEAIPESPAVDVSSTGLWNELRLLGLCVARMPLAIIERGARALVATVRRA